MVVEEEVLTGALDLLGVPRRWPNDLKGGIRAEPKEQEPWGRSELSLVSLDQELWESMK